MTRSRSVLLAALLLMCAAPALAGCGARTATTSEAGALAGAGTAPGAGWERLPDPPLAPRTHAVMTELAGDLLIVGGWEFLCPPGADCATQAARLTDGAILDPGSGTWRPIAAAPYGLLAGETNAVTVGTTMYALAECTDGDRCRQSRLVAYDTVADAWDDLGPVPAPGYRALLAVGERLALVSGSDERGVRPDRVFDPATGTWTDLPADPLPPSFDRQWVALDDRTLALTATPLTAVEDGGDDTVHAAVLTLPGDAGGPGDPAEAVWRRVDDVPGDGGYGFTATSAGGLRNGRMNPGPGWLLDPVAGTWRTLPDPGIGGRSDLLGVLEATTSTWDVANSIGWTTADARVLAYDVATDSYLEVTAPPERREVYDEASAGLGRSLVVYGGQRWDRSSDGELVGEVWRWTPPSP